MRVRPLRRVPCGKSVPSARCRRSGSVYLCGARRGGCCRSTQRHARREQLGAPTRTLRVVFLPRGRARGTSDVLSARVPGPPPCPRVPVTAWGHREWVEAESAAAGAMRGGSAYSVRLHPAGSSWPGRALLVRMRRCDVDPVCTLMRCTGRSVEDRGALRTIGPWPVAQSDDAAHHVSLSTDLSIVRGSFGERVVTAVIVCSVVESRRWVCPSLPAGLCSSWLSVFTPVLPVLVAGVGDGRRSGRSLLWW